MKLIDFEQYLNELLKPEQIKDYAPNGLQVQGSDQITKIVTKKQMLYWFIMVTSGKMNHMLSAE